MQEITSASTLEAYDALSVVETPVPRECGDKNVIVLCSKRVNRDQNVSARHPGKSLKNQVG
jgi:hypothetical protein